MAGRNGELTLSAGNKHNELNIVCQGTFGLQPPGYDLCLDALVAIGGSLQIHLGLRPSNKPDNMVFSCGITEPETPTRVPTSRSTVRQADPWNPTMVPAAPPTAPAASAPFINQAGPSYPAQQPSRNARAVPMSFTQPSVQAGPLPSPPHQSQLHTSMYLIDLSYDTYRAGGSYAHWDPTTGYNEAYPRMYGDQPMAPTDMPAPGLYPVASMPRVLQGAGHYFYN